MSRHWDECWKGQEHRLALDAGAALNLATACVFRAYCRLSNELESSPLAVHLPKVQHALDVLWSAVDKQPHGSELRHQMHGSYDELQRVWPNEDSPIIVYGWDQLLEALIYTLAFGIENRKRSLVISAIAAAYEAVWFHEIYPHTAVPLPMEEMEKRCRFLETHNQACMQDIAFQFDCLDRLERNEKISRENCRSD